MRDLKRLIELEDLLREAGNPLVRQAVAEGRRALGYNCFHVPEVLLDVKGAFGVRLRAPGCVSQDLATYYMTNRSCPYSKSILERAFEGGYNFLSALIGQECCTTMNRMESYFDYCGLVPTPGFFVTCLDVPINRSPWHEGYYERQLRRKVTEPLTAAFGLDFSEEALRAAIAEHNEVCRIVTEMGELRKAECPKITGYEFHVIQLATQVCPKDLLLPILRETLAELRAREPDPAPWYRARVMVTGSEIDDPAFTKTLEFCGAMVVADRYCFGSLPGREEIEIREGETAMAAIARHYLNANQCPRAMGPENIGGRKRYLYDTAMAYGAEGVILENMKFCEYWGYERAQDAFWLGQGFGVPGTLPVCQIERDYSNAAAGQLRTRVQAFVEALEIKRLHGEERGRADGQAAV